MGREGVFGVFLVCSCYNGCFICVCLQWSGCALECVLCIVYKCASSSHLAHASKARVASRASISWVMSITA